MTSHIEIYNLLNKVKIDDATISQLNTMTGRTAIDKETIEFWSGVITVARAMKESRTYSGGLPIPEASAVQTYPLGDSEQVDIQPSGSQIYILQNIGADNCNFFLSDGTTDSELTLSATGGVLTPIYLTNSCFLRVKNGSGSAQTPTWAYHTVSL